MNVLMGRWSLDGGPIRAQFEPLTDRGDRSGHFDLARGAGRLAPGCGALMSGALMSVLPAGSDIGLDGAVSAYQSTVRPDPQPRGPTQVVVDLRQARVGEDSRPLIALMTRMSDLRGISLWLP